MSAARLAALSLLMGFAGCATTTVSDRESSGLPAKPDDCAIDFYRDHSAPPPRRFEVVSKVESHIQKNIFFGGSADLEHDAFGELHRKACAAGADAVIVDDSVTSSAAEFSHVYVWARLVRYVPSNGAATP